MALMAVYQYGLAFAMLFSCLGSEIGDLSPKGTETDTLSQSQSLPSTNPKADELSGEKTKEASLS